MDQQETNSVWLHTVEEKLASLIADEAKSQAMLNSIDYSVRQLRAKNAFRLALLNQLQKEINK